MERLLKRAAEALHCGCRGIPHGRNSWDLLQEIEFYLGAREEDALRASAPAPPVPAPPQAPTTTAQERQGDDEPEGEHTFNERAICSKCSHDAFDPAAPCAGPERLSGDGPKAKGEPAGLLPGQAISVEREQPQQEEVAAAHVTVQADTRDQGEAACMEGCTLDKPHPGRACWDAEDEALANGGQTRDAPPPTPPKGEDRG